MTQDEKVELVARAIWNAPQDKIIGVPEAYAMKMRMTWDEALRCAKAALSTIPVEEPTTGDAVEGFDPCPFCKQYSHSLGDGQLNAAFMHFQSLIAHPMRGHPMGEAFDEKTRDAAQVLMTAALAQSQPTPDEDERPQA